MDRHYGQCDLILFVVLCFWFVLIIFAPVTTIVALIATNEFNLLNRQRDDERALDINEFVACSKDDTYMQMQKTRLNTEGAVSVYPVRALMRSHCTR